MDESGENRKVKGQDFSYKDLQESIDQVIGKIGLNKTIFLVDSFIQATTIPVEQTHKVKIISQFLIVQGVDVFELNHDDFFSSKIPEYREARIACFHLIKKYTGCSYSKLGEHFGLTKRSMMYSCERCKDRLSVPFFYKSFNEKYEILENRTIQFISKITTQ